MSKKISPEFYERRCFAKDLVEAKRNGELLRPHDGKNAIEVMREHMAAREILKRLEETRRLARERINRQKEFEKRKRLARERIARQKTPQKELCLVAAK